MALEHALQDDSYLDTIASTIHASYPEPWKMQTPQPSVQGGGFIPTPQAPGMPQAQGQSNGGLGMLMQAAQIGKMLGQPGGLLGAETGAAGLAAGTGATGAAAAGMATVGPDLAELAMLAAV